MMTPNNGRRHISNYFVIIPQPRTGNGSGLFLSDRKAVIDLGNSESLKCVICSEKANKKAKRIYYVRRLGSPRYFHFCKTHKNINPDSINQELGNLTDGTLAERRKIGETIDRGFTGRGKPDQHFKQLDNGSL